MGKVKMLTGGLQSIGCVSMGDVDENELQLAVGENEFVAKV